MVSDRHALIAVMNAILGLAERLTGERMTVPIDIGNGETIFVSGANVDWNPSAGGGAVSVKRCDAH